mgnify:CR=1 FL=1
MRNKLIVALIVLGIIAPVVLYFYLKAPTHNIASDHVDRAAEVNQWDLQGTYDMVIDAYDDPKLPVTCGMSHIVDDFAWNDPSNMSVTCRRTAYIDPSILSSLPKSEDVFSRGKGLGYKSIYIRRVIDVERKMIHYVAYSSTLIDGSFKNSLSSVSLATNEPVRTGGNDNPSVDLPGI